jgi:uridine phosphorylase
MRPAGTNPSPVLDAMGVAPESGMGAIRFSLGRSTTREVVEATVSALQEALAREKPAAMCVRSPLERCCGGSPVGLRLLRGTRDHWFRVAVRRNMVRLAHATVRAEAGRLTDRGEQPPILAHKFYGSESAFTPESLLREARRQKGRSAVSIPRLCLLDPDGDIVRQLRREGRARRYDGWVCYHTDLYLFLEGELTIGIVGCAVGASFSVLVAEELFASGCELLISITSSGRIAPAQFPPYFILIERALRDEGTSYHYMPPSDWSDAPADLLGRLSGAFEGLPIDVLRGTTWTTDAPFRETHEAIAEMKRRGVLAVEMEAAALYAFATARQRPVICFAHVTNQMGQMEGDFDKGDANGTADALRLIRLTAERLGFC